VGQKASWAIALFAAGVAAAVAAVISASQIASAQPQVWSSTWFVGVLCAAFVFIVASAILQTGAFQERPVLVFGEPEVHLRGINGDPPPGGHAPQPLDAVAYASAAIRPVIGTYQTTHVGPSHTTAWFAYVPIENRPRRGGTDAANVRARLIFRNADGMVITQMHGRWAETDMDLRRDRILRAPEIPLPANGNARLLDVAFKYAEDDQCHAMNDENVVYPFLRHRPLGNCPVRVYIELRGSGCRADAEFDLTHDGVGSHPQLARRS
jgi:hypothetical protein